MNVFEDVKQSVTTRQAAEHFGIRVGRNGMCVCPFHADKNPSMKVDRRFHCFGCQADGEVMHEEIYAQTPRATKDIDIILIVEALSSDFAAKFWEFENSGNHRSPLLWSRDYSWYG